jgi:oligopeptide transport system substrate-binding protein
MEKFMRNILWIILISVLLIACSKKQDLSNYFKYNETQGIENLDPVMCSNYASIWPVQQTCEGLMEFTQDMKLVTNLASSYKISEDGLVYSFILHKNVFFHDDDCFADKHGSMLIANDFKYCFERLCDPRTKTRGAWLFRDRVEGAADYINSIKENNLNVNEITGIQAPNDSTLIIKLTKPFAPFLSILTMAYCFVYPKQAVEYYKENFGYHTVGTGPFKFAKWEFDKELELARNDNYWKKNKEGKALVYLDGIKINFIKSSETAFLDFKEGKFDYYDPSPEVLSQITDENGKLLSQYDFDLIRQPWLNTVYLGVQLDKETPGGKNNILSDNKKLRQAINYAIDREKLIKYILKFRGKPGNFGPTPIGMPGFSENVKGYYFDKDKTKLLLSEAGYPEGKGLNLRLTVSNEETQKLIGEAVQAQLKDVGINVQLDFMQGSTMRSSQVGGELSFWRGNWGADYFDPENFMALFYSKNKTPNGPNYTHYSNPVTDSLYELALKESNFENRKILYNNMEKIIIEDSPWIILYYNQIVYLKNKKVNNMFIDGLNTLILKWSKFEN